MHREEGIDAFRFLMAALVVILHSMPTEPALQFSLISMICRAAVPFFLITSGYFLRVQNAFTLQTFIDPIKKLAPIYVFWMIIYYSVAKTTDVAPLKMGMMDFVSGGTAFHLWYLPAAAFALVMVPASISLVGSRFTGIICVSLALLALSLGPYHDLLGLPGTPRRGGLLLAPSFVFMGYAISAFGIKSSPKGATLMTIVGILAITAEEYLLSKIGHQEISSHDFIFSTYIYGLGTFLFAKGVDNSHLTSKIAKFGALSLGIYVTQLLFLWAFRSVIDVETLADVAVLAACSFIGAAALTAVLRKIKSLRIIVG